MVMGLKSKAIFFDRDGVLVKSMIKDRKPYAVQKIKDFKIYKQAKKLIKKMNDKGFKTFVITNQPDVENGVLNLQKLNKMHKKLKRDLKLKKIFTCIHKAETKCKCRKPSPYMIKEASKIYKLNLKKSYVIGDRKIDIDSGFFAGCKTVFIDRNYKEKKPSRQNFTTSNLTQAINFIENDSIK